MLTLAGTSSAGPSAAGAAESVSVDVSAFATQPVVLTGADFPGWSSEPEVTARAPPVPNHYGIYNSQADQPSGLQSDCYQFSLQPEVNGSTDVSHNDHNCFRGSQSPVGTVLKGVKPASLRGYGWTGHGFVQIPFQVVTVEVRQLVDRRSAARVVAARAVRTPSTNLSQPCPVTASRSAGVPHRSAPSTCQPARCTSRRTVTPGPARVISANVCGWCRPVHPPATVFDRLAVPVGRSRPPAEPKVSRSASNLIRRVTDAVMDDVREWAKRAKRPLDDVFPIVFLDRMVLKIREADSVQRPALHRVLGVTLDGDRDVLGMWFQEAEGSFW